ncbi:hypothetical protein Sa4125_29960 [Aureimonas sp. SA4125]|uniref:hypothetical protein n=1 Tax=Aureimonas sp. SA4125 TaxID=2826993 RepID=UPI001CC450AE|nr:hypothetical protein [Aureimonas sp. SA4125]BDA85454.1 hypothetical protein Sa4125_29960 [Aureimonas sp. SA4125]
MSDLRAIEIDFDVHKLIETERRSFGEKPNDALRRLLGLAERSAPSEGERVAPAAQGRPWVGEGMTLPHATALRMSYNKRQHVGEIVDGRWAVEGKVYDSPSGAASDVGRTKGGGKTRLDGWNYWEAQLPGESEWKAIASMRPGANMSAEDLIKELNL